MDMTISDYFLQLPEKMHFAEIQELSASETKYYRMLSDYGNGSFQLTRFNDGMLFILIADFTPKETFEKVATISEEYIGVV